MNKRLFITFLFIVMLCLSINVDVHAEEYLPITYHKTIYKQEKNKRTTVYWSLIPKQYKPAYAVANNKIGTAEEPSKNAKRNKATLATNLGWNYGIYVVNRQLLQANNIKKYDALYMDNSGSLFAVPNSIYDTQKILAQNPVWAGQGFFAIYKDGKYQQEFLNSLGSTDYLQKRHPRTFIGQDLQGNYFVGVCEGRRSTEAGMRFDEIYDFVKKYITTDIKLIYNADGGGSSGFIYKGKKINRKLDNGGRTERKTYNIIYWSAQKYTISFNTNGGSKINSLQTMYGNAINKPTDPVKLGYAFGGWYKDPSFKNEYNFKDVVTNNLTLYAKWTSNGYTITFNSNGGSSVSPITQAAGTKLVKPADPVKSGYTFAGWFTDSNLTKQFVFNTMPSNNLTLYAKWTSNVYTSPSDDEGQTQLVDVPDTNSNISLRNIILGLGLTFGGTGALINRKYYKSR